MADTCNTGYQRGLKDALGNYIGFMVNGTDEAVGVVDMTTEPDDYVADVASPDGTFRICIETAAAIEIELADGTDFTITAVQATAYLGKWYPANIKKVYKAGTTGTFSVGW